MNVKIITFCALLALAQTSSAMTDYNDPKLAKARIETLAGFDADNNGIRDDVEWSLSQFYKDSPEHLQIMFLGAQAMQLSILSTQTDDNVDNELAAKAIATFTKCLAHASQTSYISATKDLAILKTFVYNTEQRVMAHDAFNASLGDSVIPSVPITKENCPALTE